MSFEPATAANTAPMTLRIDSAANDPVAALPEAAARRLTSISQRARDAHSTLPDFETLNEAAQAVAGHERRINDLVRPKSAGGFGLSEGAQQVVDERRKLERAEQELARLQSLKDIRGARWTAVKQLETAVATWVLRGVPGGCTLEPVADAPLAELLTKADNGRIDAAVERCRHRLRMLQADAHSVRSAPFPSKDAKRQAREQISALAAAAAPDLDRLIEHNQPISFATTRLMSLVHNVEQPAATFSEVTDTLGLLCWLFPDQIIARIERELDAIADDEHALSEQQRQEREAVIAADKLMIERAECALIWHAEAKGEVIDFRRDTTPLALLGLRLITAPRSTASPGSSPGHSFNIAVPGAQRRR